MSLVFKQDTRQGHLHTALGGDQLGLQRFHGADAVNDLFAYHVEAISTSDTLDPNALIGTSASVELRIASGGPRWFNGIVAEAAWIGADIGGYRYDLALRPWLWLAGLRRNQRIFHDKSVVAILQQLFEPYAKHGKPALDVRLTGSYDPIEYCVQYRESDLHFARRMMERFGISFFFEHGDGAHTLVLVDSADSLPSVPGGRRPFRPRGAQQIADDEHLWSWRSSDGVATGAIRLTDYDFKNPQAAMEVGVQGDATHENGQIESFDFPGDYLTQAKGKAVADLRSKQARASAGLHRVTGSCASLGSGMTVTVTGDAIPFAGQAYACLETTFSLGNQSYAAGAAGEPSFSATHALAPVTAPLVPARLTPAPVIPGPQTAVVVGEGKIDCDEHGRILVRFHWDLEKAHSMRCRVAQSWASQGWGGVTIPRIGMEVVVEFLDGDPDRPLVTGAVYNGRNKPPYPLPAHHSKTVLRSQSVEAEGFNEITFEDKAAEENLFLHAQRNLTARILRGRFARVGRNDVLSVAGNRSTETGGSEKREVGKSFGLVVGGAGDTASAAAGGVSGLAGKTAELLGGALGVAGASAGKFASSISATTLGFFNGQGASNRAALVKDDSPRPDGGAALAASAEKLGDSVAPSLKDDEPGVMHVVVASHKSESVGVSSVEQVGKARVTHVGAADFTHVGKTRKATVGEHDLTEVGKTKKITVGDELVIEVGSARLQMKKDGTVILQGKTFNFTASGPVQINGTVVDLNKPGG